MLIEARGPHHAQFLEGASVQSHSRALVENVALPSERVGHSGEPQCIHQRFIQNAKQFSDLALAELTPAVFGELLEKLTDLTDDLQLIKPPA